MMVCKHLDVVQNMLMGAGLKCSAALAGGPIWLSSWVDMLMLDDMNPSWLQSAAHWGSPRWMQHAGLQGKLRVLHLSCRAGAPTKL